MAAPLSGFLVLVFCLSCIAGQKRCTNDSLNKDGDKCTGEMMEVLLPTEGDCNEESFIKEGDSCMGALVKIIKEPTKERKLTKT